MCECAYNGTQVQHTIQHRTVLIIFPRIFQSPLLRYCLVLSNPINKTIIQDKRHSSASYTTILQ